MEPTPQELLETCRETARRAGDHAYANRARCREVLELTRYDIKLALDRECQVVANSSILSRYSAHAILGEEESVEQESKFEWIVDPIDGTMNFYHGFAHWCCSVAVRRSGELLAGAVYQPVQKEMYLAAKGIPSTCNAEAIQVSGCAKLEESMVLCGLGKPDSGEDHTIDNLRRLVVSAQKTRVLGAAAVDLCMVACGRAEAYSDNGINIWDFAAAGLIVEQAGGMFEILEDTADGRQRILASNAQVHQALKAVLTDRT